MYLACEFAFTVEVVLGHMVFVGVSVEALVVEAVCFRCRLESVYAMSFKDLSKTSKHVSESENSIQT